MENEVLMKNCTAFLDETMNLNDLPGLAIGVSIGGTSVSDGSAGVVPDTATPKATAEFIGVRGYQDHAARTPLAEDDIFHCASVSKLFTSSAIMKLVEAGVLDLNARLCDILPDLCIVDRRYEEIRLWNMLTHTSGLGDVEDYHWYDFETDEDSLRRYVYDNDEVLAQPMLWEPQETRFRYSNIAYEILGQIVSEYSVHMPGSTSVTAGHESDAAGHAPSVANQVRDEGSRLSYEDFVARYLLEPAGMTSSTMKTFERPGAPDFASNEHMAKPHEKKSDRSIGPVHYYPYTRQHAPSSTLTSNVSDLLRWGRAHLASARGDVSVVDGGVCSSSGCGPGAASGRGAGAASDCAPTAEASAQLLRPETYRKIWRPYATVPNNGEQMGLGWFMREQKVTSDDGTSRTYQLCGHEGTDDGFRASFWICPELDMVTVVLSNLSGAPVKRISKKLFDRITR